MPGILVVGEVAPDGSLTKLSTEVATLGRTLGESGAGEVHGLIAAPDPAAAATTLARYVGQVQTHDAVSAEGTVAPVGALLATLADRYDVILLPASADGRDLAGALSALTGLGVLGNATAVRWDGGPITTHSVFGGKLITEAAFSGGRGIITVRPNSVTAAEAASPSTVQPLAVSGAAPALAEVVVTGHDAPSTTAASIDDARIIVSGGRGVGGPEGFRLLEDLAAALGGAVGATRAAVDSGWIPYSQQIGQTGKIVKPQLYLALGISGAIQHKVGMQTAETIVAVNRDPDAPMAEFADLFVVGDLFEVGQAMLDQLRSRTG